MRIAKPKPMQPSAISLQGNTSLDFAPSHPTPGFSLDSNSLQSFNSHQREECLSAEATPFTSDMKGHNFSQISIFPPLASVLPIQQKPESSSGTVIQRVEKRASEEETKANQDRKLKTDSYVGRLKSKTVQGQYGITNKAGRGLDIIHYGTGATLSLHELLTKLFPNDYGKADEKEQRARHDEVEGRMHHDEHVKGTQLQEPADINLAYNANRACVITALMYAEGGSLMGADSVEGLHQILFTRFPKTWGQYSDDNIIPTLYNYYGYHLGQANGKLHEAVAASQKEAGMVSAGGHMVGFKRQGNGSYVFLDNESGESPAETHPHGKKNAVAIWHK